jgi:hypothetical protein
MRSALVLLVVASGCVAWTSHVTVSGTRHVVVDRRTAEACAVACAGRDAGDRARCLAACPGAISAPGGCAAEDPEMCAETAETTVFERAGRCTDAMPELTSQPVACRDERHRTGLGNVGMVLSIGLLVLLEGAAAVL